MKLNHTLNAVNELPTHAAIACFRALANSNLAKCIGAINRVIQLEASGEEERLYEGQLNSAQRAKLFHDYYHLSCNMLLERSNNKWDMPMDFGTMFEFLIKADRGESHNPLVNDVSKITGVSPEHLHAMQHAQQIQQANSLAAKRQQIEQYFNDLPAPEALDDIETTPLVNYQQTLKAIEGLQKATANLARRMLNPRFPRKVGTEQAEQYQLGIVTMSEFARELENEEPLASIIEEALSKGANLTTLDDVISQD